MPVVHTFLGNLTIFVHLLKIWAVMRQGQKCDLFGCISCAGKTEEEQKPSEEKEEGAGNVSFDALLVLSNQGLPFIVCLCLLSNQGLPFIVCLSLSSNQGLPLSVCLSLLSNQGLPFIVRLSRKEDASFGSSFCFWCYFYVWLYECMTLLSCLLSPHHHPFSFSLVCLSHNNEV